mmetsp:Transcript_1603/g.9898  ORF Transcript_1603/g.9898 Transcript_1603/m.9898 type:complete len:81 (+) Transcript_1603:68-310(+)
MADAMAKELKTGDTRTSIQTAFQCNVALFSVDESFEQRRAVGATNPSSKGSSLQRARTNIFYTADFCRQSKIKRLRMCLV